MEVKADDQKPLFETGNVETVRSPAETAASEAAHDAVRETIEQHLAETAPAGRKPKGVKQYPKRGESPAAGSGKALGKNSPAPAQAEAGQPAAQPFDEATMGAMVEAVTEMMNGLASTIITLVAKKNDASPEETREAVANVQMSERAKKLFTLGAMGCAKKYNLALGPEFMLAGGLLMWGGSIVVTAKMLVVADAPKPVAQN